MQQHGNYSNLNRRLAVYPRKGVYPRNSIYRYPRIGIYPRIDCTFDLAKLEQRLKILRYLKIFFISLQHPVEPGEQLLGTVVRVEDDGDVVVLGHEAHVLGPGNGAQDGGLLLGVLDALAGQEGGPAVGELDDDGGVDGPGRLQHRVDGGGGGAVECCK